MYLPFSMHENTSQHVRHDLILDNNYVTWKLLLCYKERQWLGKDKITQEC